MKMNNQSHVENGLLLILAVPIITITVILLSLYMLR